MREKPVLKEQFDPRLQLNAWAVALMAVEKLQQELEAASHDMTVQDDWSWQEPFRETVREVWQVIATTPADKRLEVARGYTDLALSQTALVRVMAQERVTKKG
jgi:hypothetical protein